jgi:uncharacterized membrane protein YcaP (DUF421 family)
MFDVNWQAIFQLSLGLAEIFIRGSLMYLALFVIFRFIARRQAGSFGPADLLVIVLIADASANALGKDYTSVTEGIALVSTIVAWEHVIDWAAWRFPKLRPYLTVPAVKLIENGVLIRETLEKEMLLEDEVRAQLRQKGIEAIEDVKLACLEGDGQFGVISHPSPPEQPELFNSGPRLPV